MHIHWFAVGVHSFRRSSREKIDQSHVGCFKSSVGVAKFTSRARCAVICTLQAETSSCGHRRHINKEAQELVYADLIKLCNCWNCLYGILLLLVWEFMLKLPTELTTTQR